MLTTLEICDGPIEVEDTGSGDAVLLIHAGMWRPQVSWLTASHRVVRCDFWGYGSTPPRTGRVSCAACTREIMDRLGIRRAAIVGASMGGATAIRMACLYPDRIAGLVLASPSLHGYMPTVMDPGVPALQEAARTGDAARFKELSYHHWVFGAGRTEQDLEPSFRQLTHDMLHRSLTAEDAVELVDEDGSDADALHAITAPVMVVVGGREDAGIQEMCRVIAAGIPHAEHHVIADSAHVPTLERPQAFDPLLRLWLARIARRQ